MGGFLLDFENVNKSEINNGNDSVTVESLFNKRHWKFWCLKVRSQSVRGEKCIRQDCSYDLTETSLNSVYLLMESGLIIRRDPQLQNKPDSTVPCGFGLKCDASPESLLSRSLCIRDCGRTPKRPGWLSKPLNLSVVYLWAQAGVWVQMDFYGFHYWSGVISSEPGPLSSFLLSDNFPVKYDRLCEGCA